MEATPYSAPRIAQRTAFVQRILDVSIAAIGLSVGAPVFLLLLLVGYFDTGSPIFKQERVGLHQKPFILRKFRTMKLNTESTATHLVDSSRITRVGKFLRATKLDELPQLWNVLLGEMSMVGPRPCLYCQTDLIAERQKYGIFDVRPGMTGLAQVKGIDMENHVLLAATDAQMLSTLSTRDYFRYLLLTAIGCGAGDRVRC